MKKIGFLRKSPTYGNDLDYNNVSKLIKNRKLHYALGIYVTLTQG